MDEEELPQEEYPQEEYPQEEYPGVIPTEFSSQARRSLSIELDEDGRPPEYLPRDYSPPPVAAPATPSAPRGGRLQLNERGEPPEYLTPDELMNDPGVSSRYGAFGRGAAEGVIPGAAGMAGGILAGAGSGAAVGAMTANPIGIAAGTIGGGVLGGILAGYAGSRAQEWALEQLGMRDDPESMFSRRQQQADVAQFPYSRFAGEMAPSLATLRPGGTALDRVISGGIGAGAAGIADYVERGEVDPYKVLMGGAAGVALPNINRPTSNLVGRAAPRSWQPHMPNYEAPPPPEPPPPPPAPPPQLALPAPEPFQRTKLPYEVTPAPPEMAQLPSPERAAAVESLGRQIETARLNRDQHQPGDMIGLHAQWSAHHDSLVERHYAMLHGKADAGTEASEGLGGPTPTRQRMDQFNDATTTASGNAMVNRPPPEDAGIGMGPAAAGNKPVRAGPVDESKAAVRVSPGEPTVPSTPVIQGHAAPDIALAAKAAQPEAAPARAAPPAAPPPVAPAEPSQSSTAARPAARPIPTEAQKQAHAAAIQQQVAQAQRMGSREPRPAPPPTAEPAPTGIHPQEFASRLLKAAKGDPVEAIKFLDAAVKRDPALARGMPVREARELLTQRATAPVTPARPAAAQAAIRGERPAPRRATAEQTREERKVETARLNKQYAEDTRSGKLEQDLRTAQPKPPEKTETGLSLPEKWPPTFEESREQLAAGKQPATPVAKRPTLTLPGKKETVGQKLVKGAKGLLESEKGSLSIGPFGRRPTALTKEQATKQLAGRYWPSPGMRPHEIASVVTTAAEGDPRYALTLLNRRMTEHKGWALRQDIIKARDILFREAEKIEMRPEPSPEVPVVPGKTRADLQPPKTELIPKKREYTPPGERTQMVITDTGEVREPITFREERKPEPLHGLGNYTPEERGRFIEALDKTLPQERHTEALALTKSVPKEKVLANLDKLPGFLEQERAGRTAASRETKTGAGAENKQYKAHREGILAAHETAVAANPRPVDKAETLGETRARAERIVKAANEETNRTVAELTRANPKSASVFTGQLDISRMKNPPSASKVVRAARALVQKPTPKQKLAFDTEETLALAPETEQRAGGLTGNAPETAEAAMPAGPRYEARVDPDSPTFTSSHKDLTDMLNGLSDRAHDMMQDAHGESIDAEVRHTKDPAKLKADLLGALIDAQDKENRYAHALPDYGTLVKTTPVSDRAGIQRVEQTGRFKPTKPTDFQNLTEAEKKAAPVRGIDQVTVDTYRQIKAAVEEFFGRKALPGKLAKGEIGGTSPEKTEKWLQQTGRILGEIPHDYRGGLDVTKIFDWIDKTAKKFRPDREPMVPTGMTRLYRAESRPESVISEGKTPDWVKDTPEYKGIVNATGRWFTASREELNWYTNFVKANQEVPITKYVDVPTSVVEQYRVDNLSGAEGKAAQRFSRRWDKEFFLPREIADRRVAFEPEDMGIVDHLRKLWADERGVLDVSKLTNWLPNARSRARSEFDPTAAQAQKNYADSISAGDSIGHAVVKLRTSAANMLKDNLYAGREAGIRPPAETDIIGRAIENRTEGKLTAAQQKWLKDHVEPLHKEYNERFIRTRDLAIELGVPGSKDLPEPVDLGVAGSIRHLPRRQVQTASDVEAYDPRFTNTNPLAITKPGLKERGWFALLEDGTKAREIFHVNDNGDMVTYNNGKAGTVYRSGNFPKDFKPGQVGERFGKKLVDNASIEEIMRHGRGAPTTPGGDPVKLNYERNPMFVLGLANKDLIYAETRLKFLKALVNDPDFQNNVATSREAAAEKWGEKKIKQTILEGGPFDRKWFPKPVAWALDDLVKQGFNYGGNQALEAISRFNQAALKPFYFVGPIVHPLNEADKLVIGRGYDNLNLPKTLRNLKKGLDAVREQGDVMTEVMEAGGNPMFIHALVSRFDQNYAKALGVELAEKAWKYDPLFAKAGINTKAKYWEPLYQGQNKGMWWSTDAMYMMLYHDMKDRMGGGHKNWEKKAADLEKLNGIEKPTAAQAKQRDELAKWTQDLARKSVVEAEKIIDGYTVPTTFGKTIGLEGTDIGRLAQQTAVDPATANFGRYSYGLIKTLVNIGKNMAGKNENLSAGHSAALGFSQAAMLMGMVSMVYPALSKLYSMAPWAKPESEFEDRGVSRVAKIGPNLYNKGLKDVYGSIAARALSPSVGLNLAATTYFNRDNVGRPIMESAGKGGWAAVPLQLAGHAFDQIISPAGQVSRAYAQEGAEFATKRFIESNFGVKTPSAAQVKYERQRPQTEKRQGQSRERHPRGVFDILGNKARQLVRGYEEGGLVTATATGVIPTSGG